MLTAEQLQQRKGKMTSSVVAGALGLNPHMSPLQAWIAITGRDTFEGSKATDRGNRLEALVLDYPCAELDLKRFDAPFVDGARFGRPWSGDSTDALYGKSRRKPLLIGEGKTAALFTAGKYGAEGTDEIPQTALVQAHWHLIHWPDVDRCVVPVLVGGYRFEFRAYYVQRDAELEGRLLALAEKFHTDHVKTDMPPAASANDNDAIARLFPSSSSAPLIADEQIEQLARDYDAARSKATAAEAEKQRIGNELRIEQLARDYDAARSKATAAEAEKQRIGNELRMALGPHQGAANGEVSITYATQRPSLKTDWIAVAAEAGISIDLIRKHSTQVPGKRPLTVHIKETK